MGTIDGSVLTFEADSVTYKYDTGFGEPVVFTLTAELNEIGQDGVEDGSADRDDRAYGSRAGLSTSPRPTKGRRGWPT